ncbi:hypothetical protein C0Q70_19290 [Pomacea canaliculata]|uniref:Uncharacterized protein n=1 Tax=Pomacea canaliculata TaxID=400727 RepID=A0A2T7NIY2_POMCA|nr:hypothetical protein C0Q70_19290 [Pomacea canaliculata]
MLGQSSSVHGSFGPGPKVGNGLPTPHTKEVGSGSAKSNTGPCTRTLAIKQQAAQSSDKTPQAPDRCGSVGRGGVDDGGREKINRARKEVKEGEARLLRATSVMLGAALAPPQGGLMAHSELVKTCSDDSLEKFSKQQEVQVQEEEEEGTNLHLEETRFLPSLCPLCGFSLAPNATLANASILFPGSTRLEQADDWLMVAPGNQRIVRVTCRGVRQQKDEDGDEDGEGVGISRQRVLQQEVIMRSSDAR